MSSRNESLAGERLRLPVSSVLAILLFWGHKLAVVSASLQQIRAVRVHKSFSPTTRGERICAINNWSYAA